MTAMKLNGLNNRSQLLADPLACLAYGAYVRASRNALGLNQTVFARLLGVSRPTVVRLERGASPLRLALCYAATDVLSSLGVTSANIEDFEVSNPKPARIFSSVEFAKLLQITRLLEEQADPERGVFDMLGSNFRPPLIDEPLRSRSQEGKAATKKPEI